MFIDEKAKEISLAIIKISVSARRAEFRRRLETLAFDLLEAVGAKNYELTVKTIEILGTLVKFGRIIYEIEPINAKILIEEFGHLNSAIRQIAGFDISESGFIDIHSIFSSKSNNNIEKTINEQAKKDNSAIADINSAKRKKVDG